MDNITFALPTIPTSSMNTIDQRSVLLNQATAVIVSEYLGHMNVAIEKGIFPTTASQGLPFFTQAELVTLINDVQGALTF